MDHAIAAVDSLTASFATLVTAPPSLVEALDDDSLRAVFSICAGARSKEATVDFTVVSPAAAC